VKVLVGVYVLVGVGVIVGVPVTVAVGVMVGVSVTVAVGVLVAVSVAVAVGVLVGVMVGVSVGNGGSAGLDRFWGLLGAVSLKSFTLSLESWPLPAAPPGLRS
jgi:hypothetical protein